MPYTAEVGPFGPVLPLGSFLYAGSILPVLSVLAWRPRVETMSARR